MGNNLILNFTNVYEQDVEKDIIDAEWIDCTDICGCDMYCTKEAENEIKRRINPFGANGIHFLDSGNYHYVTEFFLEKIKQPFSLVLFDYHNDMQLPKIHDFTSCGGWAGKVLKENSYLEQLILIGPDENTIDQIQEEYHKKLISISLQELEHKKVLEQLKKINKNIPLYITIDKDVLNKHYARTNWNQGNMSIKMLETIINNVLTTHDILGADICGEQSINESFGQYMEDNIINKRVDLELVNFLKKYFGLHKFI